MNKINKVKFFLVAATLIGSASAAFAEDFSSDDPNLASIAVPEDGVTDNAMNPIAVDCHDCGTTNRAGVPLGKLFQPHGVAGANGSESEAAER